MRNVTKSVLTALFGFAMLTTAINAGSINKGQKIYDKKIKGQCGDKTGGAFAATFKQKEWEDAFKTGIFEAKVKEVCPTVETYKEKWTPYLFEFAYEYAKDTGNKPAF
jgi:hypothetical protein